MPPTSKRPFNSPLLLPRLQDCRKVQTAGRKDNVSFLPYLFIGLVLPLWALFCLNVGARQLMQQMQEMLSHLLNRENRGRILSLIKYIDILAPS